METRNCQNCKQDFTIDQDDFNFYAKINVPPPTFCPQCRFQRRVSFFNLSKFYKRACDKCGKQVICLHAPDKPYKMYCNQCWWADDWDGTEYAMEYDERRPFFEQLIELRDKSNFVALESLHPSNTRTEYTNNASYQKDCFMTMFADYNEYCAYVTVTAHTKDTLDCYRIKESEKCYECVGVYKSYNCSWSEEIDTCVDCMFCRSCYSCSNCVGCINLRGKSYCIFNVQYSKEEYFEKLKQLGLNIYEKRKSFRKKVEEFWLQFPHRSYNGNSLNVNVSGDFVYESRNTQNAYLVSGAENSRFVEYLTLPKTHECYDYTGWGAGAELLYECFIVGDGAYNDRFCAECWPNPINTEYSYFSVQGKDCFGCVNLKRKSYCILNKQYTKEKYLLLKEKIIRDMKARTWNSKVGHTYTYGEFLPPELSPFGYNETVASEYLPLSKEEAENAGYNWYEPTKVPYAITIQSSELPQSAEEISEKIMKEVIQCSTCDKGYNISVIEFDLLKRLGHPLPHSCPSCRHVRRFSRTNKPALYDRTCDKCKTSIKTSYAPDRPEIIYCEKCYQQEVV